MNYAYMARVSLKFLNEAILLAKVMICFFCVNSTRKEVVVVHMFLAVGTVSRHSIGPFMAQLKLGYGLDVELQV
jgi:hypothetical protein